MFKIAVVFFFILFLIAIVGAAPPQTSNPTIGIQIRLPQAEAVKVNTGATLHTHIFNASGAPILPSSGTSCMIHLYNQTGDHLMDKQMAGDSNGLEYELNIHPNNFSSVGERNFIIICNDSRVGGFVSGMIEVTGTGDKFDTPMAIFYVGVMAVLSFFFVVVLLLLKVLPQHKEMGMDGRLMSVNSLAHLKLPIIGVAWGILLMISFLAWNVAEAYLVSELVVMTFRIIFSTLMWTMMIGLPVLGCYWLYKMIADSELKQALERGIM